MSHVDKGWAWVVMFAVLCSNVIVGLQYCSVTIFYTTFLQVFEESRAFTSWLGSLNSIVFFCCGPLASYLLPKIGIRNIFFIAAGCSTVAYIIISLSTSLVVVILANGIFGGIGSGFAVTSGVAAIASYFDHYLFKASSIGLIGNGIGAIFYGPLLERLIQMYGWRGASLLFSGMSLQFFVVASTVFPVPLRSPNKKLLRRGPAYNELKKRSTDKDLDGIAMEEQHSPAILDCLSLVECKDTVTQSRRLSPKSKLELQGNTEMLTTRKYYSDIRFWCLSYIAFAWGFCAMPIISTQKDVISSAGLVEHFQLAVLISGISNTLARIVICFLTFDNVLLIYLFVLFLGGLIVPCYAIVTNYWTLAIVSLFCGVYLGASYVMLPMVVGAIYGRQEMATTYGYVIFFVGLSSMGGPSLIGYLRDVTGVYSASLYLIGGVQLTGALMAGFLHFWMKRISNVQ